ncbi:MAG TPA: helicase C-terminal domain-containing protein [Symbiobacteriaceae bacterium]|nr:helicase C-terminal domain-containing protein [Symbiobacteriaceae bacterium]
MAPDITCELTDLAAVLGGSPADALARLNRLDTGLVGVLATLSRPTRPAVSLYLEQVAEARQAEGMAPGPATDWVTTHERTERAQSGKAVSKLDLEAAAAVLGASGPLARVMAGYEPRRSQVEVLHRVTAALNENHHLLMEAPTGTGKSLAYLIPAALWALQNEERVLIATHTIALQEQLLAKDLPLLERILGRPVRAAVLKGRSNYVCLRKWEEAVGSLGFQASDAETEWFARISAWVGQTATGDRGEVVRDRADSLQWEAIASDTATCLGPACKWYARHCFAHRARREANAADLLITNHALLCAQLRLGNQGFPAFRRVIIDEAHQLEAVATGAFTVACSLDQVQSLLTQLNDSVLRGAVGNGLILSLSRKLGRPFAPVISNLTLPPDRDLFDLLADVTVDARHWLSDVRGRLGGTGANRRTATLRLDRSLWERQPDLRTGLLRLGACLSVLNLGLKHVMEALAERGDDSGAAGVRGRLQLLGEAVDVLRGLLASAGDQVAWAESDRDVVLNVAPLYPGAQLKEKLFDAYPTVALVSATLTVGGSFAYAARGLGLDLDQGPTQARVHTAVVDSPFAWKEQALLLALEDAPAPRGSADPAYVRRLTESLGQLLPAVGGQCLVLFTANAVLEECLNALKSLLAERGITLLGQGLDGTPTQLVERLKTEPNIVVFGSGSFWEGVDVPGEALSCLIITRLPFRPPDSPVAAARAEAEERQGRNPFDTLSLPEAVIRFRQGFGRLIRTRSDRGVVIVLDSRILPANSRYADAFLTSLPPVTRIKGSMATVLRRTAEWLGRA